MKSTARIKTLAAAGLVSGAIVASPAVTNASAVTARTTNHALTSQAGHRATRVVAHWGHTVGRSASCSSK